MERSPDTLRNQIASIAGRHVSRETFAKLVVYEAMLEQESRRQNLISASTARTLWERHILDAAQLVRFEPKPGASWVDIGSGSGIPGIVIAIVVDGPVTLMEPRRLRAEFLHRVCDSLELSATVVSQKAERVGGHYDVITGRAVARLDRFLKLSAHLSTGNSVWVLPKGRGGAAELALAEQSWHGVFHVEQSLTDKDSYIVVGSQIRARA